MQNENPYPDRLSRLLAPHRTSGRRRDPTPRVGTNFVSGVGVGGLDTGCVSLGALVQQVGQVLNRGHALFGDPLAGGHTAALDSSTGLAAAGDLVRSGQARMAGLSGRLPTAYGDFAARAGPALDDAAGTDHALGGQLQAAAGSDQSGRANSGAVVDGAATDTAALSPMTGTPAGQRALAAALRARVAQQQHIVNAYRIRDARLATMVRSLAYARRGAAGGGMPMGGGMPSFGGFGGGGGSPLGGLSGLSGLFTGGRTPRAGLTSGVGWPQSDAADISRAPGRGAAEAALSRLGCPYVWGAKGPNAFDCSGLTRWAWREAGVNLGNDTYAQITEGVPVAPGKVRAGDLIFPLDSFGEGDRGGPGHVQLAISDREVVHAPQPGDVVRVAPMPGRFIARRPVRPMQV